LRRVYPPYLQMCIGMCTHLYMVYTTWRSCSSASWWSCCLALYVCMYVHNYTVYTKQRSSWSTSYTYAYGDADANAMHTHADDKREALIEESVSTVFTNVYRYMYANLYSAYKAKILFISIIMIMLPRTVCMHVCA
jgi:hypothetical protein